MNLQLEERQQTMIKMVSITNRSGHELRGIVDLPEKTEKVPVVVNLHGFTGTRQGHKNLHTSMGRELAKAGIACVRFDFYGNGESDGEFEDMRFTGLLEDTEDIIEWVKAQEWADADKIILSGQSMGGYVASTAAPRVQPAGLILMCPGAGMWYGALERAEQFEAKGIFEADIEGLRFVTAFNRDLHNYEPFSSAQGYEGPVILIKGTADELVDERIVDSYKQVYGDRVTYVPVEGGNHNFASLPAKTACNKAIVEFAEKYL